MAPARCYKNRLQNGGRCNPDSSSSTVVCPLQRIRSSRPMTIASSEERHHMFRISSPVTVQPPDRDRLADVYRGSRVSTEDHASRVSFGACYRLGAARPCSLKAPWEPLGGGEVPKVSEHRRASERFTLGKLRRFRTGLTQSSQAQRQDAWPPSHHQADCAPTLPQGVTSRSPSLIRLRLLRGQGLVTPVTLVNVDRANLTKTVPATPA